MAAAELVAQKRALALRCLEQNSRKQEDMDAAKMAAVAVVVVVAAAVVAEDEVHRIDAAHRHHYGHPDQRRCAEAAHQIGLVVLPFEGRICLCQNDSHRQSVRIRLLLPEY